MPSSNLELKNSYVFFNAADGCIVGSIHVLDGYKLMGNKEDLKHILQVSQTDVVRIILIAPICMPVQARKQLLLLLLFDNEISKYFDLSLNNKYHCNSYSTYISTINMPDEFKLLLMIL